MFDKEMADLELAVIHGRKSLSDWDEGVRAWRTGGGDKVRHEFEESHRLGVN